MKLSFKAIFTTVFAVLSISCSGNLGAGDIDLTLPDGDDNPSLPDVTVEFNHPCAYVNASDIARAREAIKKADASDPVYASWLSLCKSRFAQSGYTANPLPVVVRGDATGTGTTENYITCAQDAAAAFQLALRYRLSDDTACADAAVAILNAWASVCKTITANDNNQYLLVGFQGLTFANAAELLRDYPGWGVDDQNKFKKWLEDLWYAKSHTFVSTHGGNRTCNLHYWSNWELANLSCQLAIGIYLEDKDKIKIVNQEFTSGKGSGAINNMIPYAPVADPDGKSYLIAQSMESGRDQGHATLVVSLCSELCQTADNIGLGFWEKENSKVLAMAEYTAKYNVKPDGRFLAMKEMPFTPYKYCIDCACADKNHGTTHTVVSSDGRGKERACWELIYAHYVKKQKCPANWCYYTKLFAEQLRYTNGVLTGDGGAGVDRFGETSAAFDQLGWGTLLFYQGD